MQSVHTLLVPTMCQAGNRIVTQPGPDPYTTNQKINTYVRSGVLVKVKGENEAGKERAMMEEG